MAARFHGQQRWAVAIAHRRSDLNCFSQSRVLCSSSVDGPDGQGRRRWRMRCSNAWNSAGACATSLHHTAGCTLATCIIWHRLQAAGPRRRPQQIVKQCSTHVCLVCALRYRGDMCLYANIFSNQSLPTRHHTPRGRGQLLRGPRPLILSPRAALVDGRFRRRRFDLAHDTRETPFCITSCFRLLARVCLACTHVPRYCKS